MCRFEIREVRVEDAAGVTGILNPIIAAGTFTAFDTPFSIEDEEAYIADFPRRGIFHVAVRSPGGGVVGFQSLEPFARYTHAFDHVGMMGTYVDLDWRRQGIATRLFQEMFKAAPKKGYEKIFTFVRADNPAALQTYLHQGFQIVGTARRHTKIGGRYIDEIVIEKFLKGNQQSYFSSLKADSP